MFSKFTMSKTFPPAKQKVFQDKTRSDLFFDHESYRGTYPRMITTTDSNSSDLLVPVEVCSPLSSVSFESNSLLSVGSISSNERYLERNGVKKTVAEYDKGKSKSSSLGSLDLTSTRSSKSHSGNYTKSNSSKSNSSSSKSNSERDSKSNSERDSRSNSARDSKRSKNSRSTLTSKSGSINKSTRDSNFRTHTSHQDENKAKSARVGNNGSRMKVDPPTNVHNSQDIDFQPPLFHYDPNAWKLNAVSSSMSDHQVQIVCSETWSLPCDESKDTQEMIGNAKQMADIKAKATAGLGKMFRQRMQINRGNQDQNKSDHQQQLSTNKWNPIKKSFGTKTPKISPLPESPRESPSIASGHTEPLTDGEGSDAGLNLRRCRAGLRKSKRNTNNEVYSDKIQKDTKHSKQLKLLVDTTTASDASCDSGVEVSVLGDNYQRRKRTNCVTHEISKLSPKVRHMFETAISRRTPISAISPKARNMFETGISKPKWLGGKLLKKRDSVSHPNEEHSSERNVAANEIGNKYPKQALEPKSDAGEDNRDVLKTDQKKSSSSGLGRFKIGIGKKSKAIEEKDASLEESVPYSKSSSKPSKTCSKSQENSKTSSSERKNAKSESYDENNYSAPPRRQKSVPTKRTNYKKEQPSSNFGWSSEKENTIEEEHVMRKSEGTRKTKSRSGKPTRPLSGRDNLPSRHNESHFPPHLRRQVTPFNKKTVRFNENIEFCPTKGKKKIPLYDDQGNRLYVMGADKENMDRRTNKKRGSKQLSSRRPERTDSRKKGIRSILKPMQVNGHATDRPRRGSRKHDRHQAYYEDPDLEETDCESDIEDYPPYVTVKKVRHDGELSRTTELLRRLHELDDEQEQRSSIRTKRLVETLIVLDAVERKLDERRRRRSPVDMRQSLRFAPVTPMHTGCCAGA